MSIKIYTNKDGQFRVTCLSTDDKPVGVIPANTILEELDTGDQYFYDAEAEEWGEHPVPSSGGDMTKAAYDADGAVEEAGGIAAYIDETVVGLPDVSALDDGEYILTCTMIAGSPVFGWSAVEATEPDEELG